MAKFKQDQILPGVTKHRSQAVKVHCSEAISANDILCVIGMSGDVMSVAKADANDITKCRGPFFVADYAASSGDITPVAIPSKLITGQDTSAAAQAGEAVYLSTTAGAVTFGAIPTAPADANAFSLHVRVGRVVSVSATTGAYLLTPGAANSAPLTGTVKGGGDTTITVTGFTAELDGAPVIACNAGDSAGSVDASIERAVIASGTLTITANGALDSSDIVTYTIYA
tara:strand:+ start:5862 stop:6542 length:681 start_codon:yes stop_codon:yes gene_type:complete